MRIASKPAENVSFAESMGRTLVREEPPPTASPAISDDATLVGAACRGDRAAFGRLYDRYARMVHGVLLARVPRTDVDDLSQDVFLLALRRLPTLREPASFGAWLATIARNLATDFHRRSVPHDQWSTETADSVVDKNSEKNAEKDHDDQAIEILETIKSLPDAYRETLILRLVEGMNGPEIAARTGMTPGSVRVNLHRGMQQLRAKLNLNTSSRCTRRGDVVTMDTGNNPSENKLLDGSDDYLWDRSGEPDPEIQKLEAILGKFQSNRPRPVLPGTATVSKWSIFQRIRLVPALAAVLAIAAIGFVTYTVRGKKTATVKIAGWDVAWMAGTPRVGPNIITGKESGRLGIGQMLETDPQSRATLRADEIGQIEVEGNTRLRLLTMGSGLKRIALDRGTIHTYIWASPGEFVVDTPSATTVDLGCAYTLQVDDTGAGTVRTSMGWVGFTLNGREAFIPAGAACATRPKVGPGTPYFEDASEKFREALAKFDFERSTPQERSQELAVVLGQARKRDALTLWHLLSRTDPKQRKLVYDRLRKLSPPPRNVTQEGILSLNRPMLDLWWNELGFDDISIWRHWERTWAGSPTPAPQK